ncbi:MAG: 2-polyprenyl-3-methyl-6-methoxy-1,4-benzoquinone monooxygenase [Gammaproteobacteria bacterium]|nr:2-polyprenyl-3-methyl-6-methoxy-1,4-benzoquinone monooxygenase [Gammaproteobacteria bacterium]MDH5214393.1 2-polyprenyl-3-methyl-6-methoxy-1,4-benzoquinone monooxygenase [Gammaproteobacteria bacterium]
MKTRNLTPIDRLISGIDSALKTVATSNAPAARPNPAAGIAENPLSAKEIMHSTGLMRVNHAGEVAAQGLYQGHAAVARDKNIEQQMNNAATEELDHLGWCEERLAELGSRPSRLSPLWYAGAFAIGAASGVLGDKWSLGFIEETENQVSRHLSGHLEELPATDARSRAIVRHMRDEEEQHGANARSAGAAALPVPIRQLMRLGARVMTRTAYWF